MASTVAIPERVSQCRCYADNARLNCTGELTLPAFTRPTATVSGAGIAGSIDTPTWGNLESQQASFASRVATPEMIACFAPGVRSLEFRAIIQGINRQNESVNMRFSCFMRVMCRGVTLGTVNNAAEMAASADFEVLDCTVSIDDVVLINQSKINNILEVRQADGRLVDENADAAKWLDV